MNFDKVIYFSKQTKHVITT